MKEIVQESTRGRTHNERICADEQTLGTVSECSTAWQRCREAAACVTKNTKVSVGEGRREVAKGTAEAKPGGTT